MIMKSSRPNNLIATQPELLPREPETRFVIEGRSGLFDLAGADLDLPLELGFSIDGHAAGRPGRRGT